MSNKISEKVNVDDLKIGTKIFISAEDIRVIVRFDDHFSGGKWSAILDKGRFEFYPGIWKSIDRHVRVINGFEPSDVGEIFE